MTINVLPDDVLLLIFHFDRVAYLNPLGDASRLGDVAVVPSWRWHRLIHVCQRWRSVVLASPGFLDLRLVCSPNTRVELMAIWPPLPIIIRDAGRLSMPEDYDFGAAIMHRSRVREIDLNLTRSQLQRLALAMQEQFPALIHLKLHFHGYDRHLPNKSLDGSAPCIQSRRPTPLPDGFLDGSAPCIESLELESISFPALPKLLLSATSLVCLSLWDIPHSGYISPEAMGASLAVLANLKFLTIDFESPLSRPSRENRCPPPPTRTVLHALTQFEFKGVSVYLEDLLAWINTPFLNIIWITFFHQLIFDTPLLSKFMRGRPAIEALDEAHMDIGHYDIRLRPHSPGRSFDERSMLRISCMKLDWELSSLAQAFTSFFPSINMAKRLYIYGNRYCGEGDTENMQWLDVFRPFTAVKSLYVSKDLAKRIASALQELVDERVTDALPSLERLYLETDHDHPLEPIQKAIEPFVAARQPLGHAIVISPWDIPIVEPFNVYQEQLSSKYHGLALWNPNPAANLYDSARVSIGDVGYLCEGEFIRMFNVMLPWNHPSNKKLGEPDPFMSLEDSFDNVRSSEFDQAEYHSPQVSKVENAGNARAGIADQ